MEQLSYLSPTILLLLLFLLFLLFLFLMPESQALYIQHLQASLLLQKSTILHQLKHQSFQLLHLSDIDILSQSLTHYSVLGSDFLIFILSSFSAFVPYSFVSSFLFPGKTQAITKEKIVATMYPI